MKRIKLKLLFLKCTALLAILGLCNFSSCEKDDPQPEYGVPVSLIDNDVDNQSEAN